MKTRVLGWISLLVAVFAWPSVARAEQRELFARFGGPTEQTPSHLCVVSVGVSPKSLPGGDLEVVPERDGLPYRDGGVGVVSLTNGHHVCAWPKPNLAGPPPASGTGTSTAGCDLAGTSGDARGRDVVATKGACASTFKLPPGHTMQCKANELRAPGEPFSPVVLQLQENVVDLHLIGNYARLTYVVVRRTPGDRPEAVVSGGAYAGVSGTPSRQLDGSEHVDLPLVPRCSRIALRLPDFDCSTVSEVDVRTLDLVDPSGWRRLELQDVPSEFEVSVPTHLAGARLALTTCQGRHLFVTEWPRLPPQQARFEPRTIELEWRRDKLADPASCPELTLPEVGASCSRPPTGGPCRYSCPARVPITLPTTARFKQKKPAATLPDEWEIRVVRPGEVLEGYLPAERRYVALKLGWDRARADQEGDRIDSVEVHTPDGRTHNLTLDVPRLGIVGLRWDDSLTYTYRGMRPFKTEFSKVEDGGVVVLKTPRAARFLQPGLAAWAGWRHLAHAEDATKWNPNGGIEMVVAIRGARAYLCPSFYIEPEIRAGVAFSSMAFSSHFGSRGRAEQTHSNIPILMVPLEFTERMPVFTDSLEFSVGAGAAWYRQVFASDEHRVAESVAFVLPRADLVWHVTRSVKLGWTFRYLLAGARGVTTSLDEAGVKNRTEAPTRMLQTGPIARFDDVF
jgi:hypothetical protein